MFKETSVAMNFIYRVMLGWEISGFRREVDGNCALLGYYVAYGDNSLPTFRDNLSAPSSTVKNPTWDRQVVPKRL
jgi:hypothetical protein